MGLCLCTLLNCCYLGGFLLLAGCAVLDGADVLALLSLDACDAELAQVQTTLATHVGDAQQRGLRVIAYEGGQHLVGVGAWMQDPTLNGLFDQANIHSRMQTLYENYLQMWKAAGGEMFVLYSDMTDMSQWGWGILEWYDQDPVTSPKYQGTFNFLYQNPRWW